MALYLITQTFAAKPEALKRERLIEASTKAKAVAKVADETISAAVAEVADIVRLTKAGVEVETAQ